MPKTLRDPAREQFWRQAIADWRASGCTIRDFCHQRQLVRTAFDHWQRELKRRDQPTQPTPQPPKPPMPNAATKPQPTAKTQATKPTPQTPAFLPVTLVPAPSLRVEVRCPTGHVVTLTGEHLPLGELFAALAVENTSC